MTKGKITEHYPGVFYEAKPELSAKTGQLKIKQHKYPMCPMCGDGYMKDDDKIRCACGNYYEKAKGGWEKYPTDKEVLQALSSVVINMVKQGNEQYVIDTISETFEKLKSAA